MPDLKFDSNMEKYDATCQNQALLAKLDSELLYYSTGGCLYLSFDILFMFLGHTNPKLWVSVNAIVVNLCKITVLRKQQLNVEI